MLYSIDRFEGNVAVLADEQENTLDVCRDQLPPTAESGDLLRLEGGRYVLDKDATSVRRAQVLGLQEKLRRGK